MTKTLAAAALPSSIRMPVASLGAMVGLLACCAYSGLAQAETSLTPYASSTIQYDSNIFRVSDNADSSFGNQRKVADTYFVNVLGLEGEYLWKQQRLTAVAEGSRFDYLDLSNLNQNAYRFGGALDWVLLSRLNGSVTFSQERTRASFADRDITQVNTQNVRDIGASANFLATNDIRFETAFTNQRLRTPGRTAPALELDQNNYIAGIRYVGVARLSAGIDGNYATGNFSGTEQQSRFKQYGGAAVIDYEASDISNFQLGIGYTDRNSSDGETNASGITGKLAYDRSLTGKTSVNIGIFRDIQAFTAGDDTVKTLGGSLGVDWEATSRITASIAYGFTDGKFGRIVDAGTGTSRQRRDSFHTFSANANYSVLRWLSVSPRVGYELRDSNIDFLSFEALLAGFTLTARLDNGP